MNEVQVFSRLLQNIDENIRQTFSTDCCSVCRPELKNILFFTVVHHIVEFVGESLLEDSIVDWGRGLIETGQQALNIQTLSLVIGQG